MLAATMAPKARKKSPQHPTSCPCGAGALYAECCQPIHLGTTAAAAPVDCMRARYSALVMSQVEYLWSTLHSQHEDRVREKAAYLQALQQATRTHRYRKLQVLDTAGPDDSGVAQVLFHAQVSWGKLDRSFVELSTFVQEDGTWRYITGTARAVAELGHAPAELTIDHWECAGHHHH